MELSLKDVLMRRVTFDVGKRRATFVFECSLNSEILSLQGEFARFTSDSQLAHYLHLVITRMQDELPGM